MAFNHFKGVAGSEELSARYPSGYHLLSSTLDEASLLGLPPSEEENRALASALEYIERCWCPEITDAYEVVGRLQHRNLLLTGCDVFDSGLTRGGFTQGQHVEVVGGTRSGKTTLCLQTAVAAACADQRVAFIDSGCGFHAGRAEALCRHLLASQRTEAARRGQPLPPDARTPASILGGIHVLRSHSAFDLVKKLDMISAELNEYHGRGERVPLDLLVIDSLSALLVPCLGNPNKTTNMGHALLQSLGRMLRWMADRYNVVVLTTCHMVGGDAPFPGATGAAEQAQGRGAKRPALRDVWASQPHVRIQLAAPTDEASPAALAGEVSPLTHQAHHTWDPKRHGWWTASVVKNAGAATGRTLRFFISEKGLEGDPEDPH